MNEKNVEYLEKQLQFSGFSDETKRELRTKISEGDKTFQLNEKKSYGPDKVEARLNFSKSDKGNYFFNSYDLILEKERIEDSMMHQFKVSYGNTFTLKEAYNLLDGRSVNKDFIKLDKEDQKNNTVTNAWSYLDNKNTNEKGDYLIRKKFGFDLKAALDKLPLRDAHIPNAMVDLISSLNKGNRQYAVLIIDGKEEKRYLEAAPRYGNITVYNEKMERQFASITKDQAQKQVQGQQEQLTGDQAPASTIKKDKPGEEGQLIKEKKTRVSRSRKGV